MLSQYSFKAKNQLLETIIENSVNEIYIFTADTLKFLYLNKKAIQNLGYDESELMKMTPVDIKPEFTTDSFRQKLSKLISGETSSINFKTTHLRKDNSSYSVLIDLKLINDDKSQFLIAYVLDSTNEESSLSKLISAQDQVTNSQSDFEVLIDSLAFGVVVIGMDKKIININNYTTNLLGYDSSDTLKGNNCCESFCTREENDCPILDGDSDEYYGETSIIKKNGEVIKVLKNAKTIQFRNKKVILESFFDISSMKEAEEELEIHKGILEKTIKERTDSLEKQREHLEKSQKALSFLLEDMDEAREELLFANQYMRAANQELESFSYSVSHDLRSPLTRMDGFSKALLELYGNKLDEKGKHYLKRIRASSQHMAELINDLLTLSRITRAEVNKQNINLSEICKKIIEEIKETNKSQNLQFEIDDNLETIGDRTLVKSMLENLIGNAYKFTRKNTDARIEIGKIFRNNSDFFFVKDNGVGFDMKYYNKLFAVFQRLHSNEEFPGTGIGLASVQRIVSKHNGQIFAESELNIGTTFFFSLNA